MRDELVKALVCEERVRVIVNSTTNLCEEARRRHGMWPTASAALGRVLSIGSIMGSMQKSENEKVTIQINGGGPIGTIMVDCFPNGDVRGFVSDPEQFYTYNDTGKLAVGYAVGREGTLKVIKDLGLKDDFAGTVRLQTGEIGDDFAYYFTVSEQVPSAVSLGVLVDTDNSVIAAGGMLIQMLPNATEEDIVKMEAVLANIKPMSELIHEGKTPEQIILETFDDAKILSTQDIKFRCHCSKEGLKGAVLATLSKSEIEEMIEEDHGCEITCDWCNTHYEFSEDELKELYNENR
mgnify:CR=1 FL=1